jgi:hypothetical protein
MTHPVSNFCHLSLVTCSHSTLVITQDSNFSVAVIVELDLLLNTSICGLKLLQQSRHCEGRVEGTKDFRTQAIHVICEMLVELPGLQKLTC